MLKKLIIGGLVAVGAVAAFKGTQVASHVRSEVRSARDWADSQVPMEKKFKVLREEAHGLDKDLDRVMTDLSREIVEVRDLAEQTGRLKAKIDADRKAFLAAGADIEKGNVKVSVERATARLEKDVAAHKKNEARLAMMEQTLLKREDIRATLQRTRDAMAGKKGELLADIDAAEAEYKLLQLAQVESKYQTDDSRLAKVKDNLREIKKTIDIRKERLAMEPVGKDDQPTGRTLAQIMADLKEPGAAKTAQAEQPAPATIGESE